MNLKQDYEIVKYTKQFQNEEQKQAYKAADAFKKKEAQAMDEKVLLKLNEVRKSIPDESFVVKAISGLDKEEV